MPILAEDVAQPMSVQILAVPEGFAAIAGLQAPTQVIVGQMFNIIFSLVNTGGDDDMYALLTDPGGLRIYGSVGQFLLSGQALPVSFPMTAPIVPGTLQLVVRAGHLFDFPIPNGPIPVGA